MIIAIKIMASPNASDAYRSLPSISVNDTGQTPECSICSEKYDDSDEDLIPRNLSCGHSLCSKCIFKCMHLTGQRTEGGTLMTCPSKCAQVTLIPQSLVQKMPKNFAVLGIIQDVRERSSSLIASRNRSASVGFNSLQTQLSNGSHSADAPGGGTDEYKCDVCEIRGATIVCPSCAVCLCMSCSEDIHSRKGYHLHQLAPVMEFMSSQESLISNSSSLSQRTNSESDILSDESLRMCKIHSNELIEYACEICCEEICKICRWSEEHREHESRLLLDIALEKKEALRRTIDDIEDCHAIWNKGFDESQELLEHLYDQSRTEETAIKTHFHAIHSRLHAKEESLLSEVRKEVVSREKSLQKQADHLAKVCAIAKDLVDECEHLLHHGTTSEVVRKADKILAQAQQYVRSEQDTTPVVTSSMKVDFSHEEDLLDMVDSLGELLVVPDRVEDLKIESTTSSTSEVSLTWKLPSSAAAAGAIKDKELAYIVEHSSGRSQSFRCVHEGTTEECVLQDYQIDEDTVHMFRVAAVNQVGRGPYSLPVSLTKKKASFLWDGNLKHPKARISNDSYTVSIGENATWVSVGTNTVLSHGRHYWEVVLDRYGTASLSRKVVIGVVSSNYHQWHRSHGIIGIKTCPIGHRSWGLACGTAKKLSSGSTFFNSFGRKHNLFKEGDSVGVFLDLNEHTLSFYRNGELLPQHFTDVYGPVIPAISFCRHKTLTLRFPPPPEQTVGDIKTPSEKSMTLPQETPPPVTRKQTRYGTL